LEPLQEEAKMMIKKLEETKGRLEQLHLEGVEVMKEHITTQLVENIVEKRTQVKTHDE
jgi:hypothetical protein